MQKQLHLWLKQQFCNSFVCGHFQVISIGWTQKPKYNSSLQRDRTRALIHYSEGIPALSSRTAMLMSFVALVKPPHQMCVQLSLRVSLRSCFLSLHIWFYIYGGNVKQHKIISVILFAQWNYNCNFFIVIQTFQP